MTGSKRYLQPKDMLLNAVHDLAELQKGKAVMNDTLRGIVRLVVTMYGDEWKYDFTVSDIGGGRSEVRITLEDDPPDSERLVGHEFALLDYVLIDRAKADLNVIEEVDRANREM